jgi:hypothetical protein
MAVRARPGRTARPLSPPQARAGRGESVPVRHGGATVLRRASIGVLAFTTLAGCGDSKEWQAMKKETENMWAAAKAWGVAKRAEAEKTFASTLDDLNSTYEAAKAKAKAAGKDASRTLDPKWEEVKRKLATVKSASADSWEKARDGLSKAYEDFKKEVSSGS